MARPREDDEQEEKIEATTEVEPILERKKAYLEQLEKSMARFNKLRNMTAPFIRQAKNYPLIRTTIVELRVTAVADHDDEQGYVCICEPAMFKRLPPKTLRRWIGTPIDKIPTGIIQYFTDRGVRHLLMAE